MTVKQKDLSDFIKPISTQATTLVSRLATIDKRADAMKLAKFSFWQRLMNWPIRESAQCHICIGTSKYHGLKGGTMIYDNEILIYVRIC